MRVGIVREHLLKIYARLLKHCGWLSTLVLAVLSLHQHLENQFGMIPVILGIDVLY